MLIVVDLVHSLFSFSCAMSSASSCCIANHHARAETYDHVKHELILQCVVSGDRPKISWFKDNYNISNNRYTATEDYGGIRRLTIVDPVPSDFGCFTCRSEESGRIDEISLKVSGATLIAAAAPTAAGASSIAAEPRSQRSRSKFHDRSVARTVASTTVTQSECGSTMSTLLLRDAKRQPVFSTRFTDRTAAENTSIKLTCQIIGSDMQVEWLRNGVERCDDNPRYACRVRDGLATLEIFSARPDDTGKWSCRAVNQFGEDECTGYLRVFAGHERRPMPAMFTRPVKGSIVKA